MAAIEPHCGAMRRDAESITRLPSRTIRFACTACGKCCNDTPMMSVVEAFELADVFLAGPLLRFSPLPEDIFATGHPVMHDEDSRSPVYVELHCKPIAWTRHNRRCPVLRDDQKCGIYDRRPGVCRVVPFDLHLRPDLVSKAPVADEALARRLGFECDWSELAPVMVAPDGVVDPSYRADYERARFSPRRSASPTRWKPPPSGARTRTSAARRRTCAMRANTVGRCWPSSKKISPWLPRCWPATGRHLGRRDGCH